MKRWLLLLLLACYDSLAFAQDEGGCWYPRTPKPGHKCTSVITKQNLQALCQTFFSFKTFPKLRWFIVQLRTAFPYRTRQTLELPCRAHAARLLRSWCWVSADMLCCAWNYLFHDLFWQEMKKLLLFHSSFFCSRTSTAQLLTSRTLVAVLMVGRAQAWGASARTLNAWCWPWLCYLWEGAFSRVVLWKVSWYVDVQWRVTLSQVNRAGRTARDTAYALL